MARRMNIYAFFVIFFLLFLPGPDAQEKTLKPFGPVPSERQLRWQRLEFYGFVHFTVNTFTGKEWGFGDEDPSIFNPSSFDPEQWVKVALSAGMKGLILTAKHHDGFCLWPSRYTKHSVKYSKWMNGKGDVVGALARACRKHGLLFGIYLSPWDRNHPEYGRPGYVEYYRNQLRELLTKYGEIFEVWFDGANGGTGYYGGARERRTIDRRTYYGWEKTWKMVRKLQPMAVIFSDAGPDIRWIGNEKGYAPDPCWAMVKPGGFYPGIADRAMLAHGDPNGTVWRPAEVDVSIRPGWFYHDSQDGKVKTVKKLFQIYLNSVGKGCNLLLNVPPDKRGLIHEKDAEVLAGFGRLLRETFKNDLARGAEVIATSTRKGGKAFDPSLAVDGDRETFWAADDGVDSASLEFDFGRPVSFDCIRMQEQVRFGQRIASFRIEAETGGGWKEVGRGKTIGIRRIIWFPMVTTRKARLVIEKSLAPPTISTFEVYAVARELLGKKTEKR